MHTGRRLIAWAMDLMVERGAGRRGVVFLGVSGWLGDRIWTVGVLMVEVLHVF